ncbi:MAG: GNAT family N-acetyltransferase [Kiritimatiellae bacterium]|nr:GNAT family N-acetyltransferase [Kiritimatiellia bacterium]
MIDGHSTTYDWQIHPGRICVWGIGAFEQHSVHLPLLTDTLSADYWARFVAEQLDAALFPTLPFGTSLEMTGFRGTVTLRPETLMQIVRDVADEAERQGFTRMILINGHGGNHVLVPVVRDINRMDRPLKIILLQPGQCCDPKLVADPTQGPNFHCSESETSMFMARWPQLVRSEREDIKPVPAEWEGLQQADLTTFGIGHFNPTGAAGRPSLATAEKGQAIINSIKQRIIPFVRERLERLDRNPRYSGPGGLAIRPMIAEDIPTVAALGRTVGFNQTEADWQMFLDVAPRGSFVAVHNGQVVGAVVALLYGSSVEWLGLILVEPSFRSLGIGEKLVSEVIVSIPEVGRTLVLAPEAMQGWWKKQGFLPAGLYHGLVCGSVPAVSVPILAETVSPHTIADVLQADSVAFGADRSAVLRYLVKRPGGKTICQRVNGELRGFCFARSGHRYFQVGPLVAKTSVDAQNVLLALLAELTGRAATIIVPDNHKAFVSWLESLGFGEEKQWVLLTRGSAGAGLQATCFALAGPDLG